MLLLEGLARLVPSMVWALSSGIVLTLGDVAFRLFSKTSSWTAALGVLVLYITGTMLMVLSFFGNNIATFTVITILFNIIGYLTAAYFLFGDTIGIRETIGLTLGLTAIIVLEGFK